MSQFVVAAAGWISGGRAVYQLRQNRPRSAGAPAPLALGPIVAGAAPLRGCGDQVPLQGTAPIVRAQTGPTRQSAEREWGRL